MPAVPLTAPIPVWTLLVYRIPPQPTRLRLTIWRRLQRMGVVYLQDAVCLLPSRPDLAENMQYVAEAIAEMGGVYHLFSATALLPGGDERLIAAFRDAADQRLEEIATRLDALQATSPGEPSDLPALEAAEEELKRERVAYLRAKRLAFFGSTKESSVEERLDSLRHTLDNLHRRVK